MLALIAPMSLHSTASSPAPARLSKPVPARRPDRRKHLYRSFRPQRRHPGCDRLADIYRVRQSRRHADRQRHHRRARRRKWRHGCTGYFGTLNVAGNVSFSPGSVYRAAGEPSRAVGPDCGGGHTTLSGGTVQVLGALAPVHLHDPDRIRRGQRHVPSLSTNVFLTAELSYTPTSVLLSLQQTLPFTSAAATPNQASVAAALGLSPSNPLFQAVLAQTSVAGAQQAFNALSGEIHSSVQTTMIDDSRYIREAILGRLRQAPYCGATGPMAALATGGPMVAYANRNGADPACTLAYPDTRMLAYADTGRSTFPVKAAPLAVPLPPPELTFWAQGVGAWGKINSDGNAAAVSRNLGGFLPA